MGAQPSPSRWELRLTGFPPSRGSAGSLPRLGPCEAASGEKGRLAGVAGAAPADRNPRTALPAGCRGDPPLLVAAAAGSDGIWWRLPACVRSRCPLLVGRASERSGAEAASPAALPAAASASCSRGGSSSGRPARPGEAAPLPPIKEPRGRRWVYAEVAADRR